MGLFSPFCVYAPSSISPTVQLMFFFSELRVLADNAAGTEITFMNKNLDWTAERELCLSGHHSLTSAAHGCMQAVGATSYRSETT